ncbi:MAG: biopolymer transporter ExbD [Bdellovibrionaceae bacterium]|nr:biopolymer transporter ExbD [Pseudobdellovibrionaceae bacterium]MDW8189577.1 biopolymer transporter ExbD [Pseudobdellovibrionaceae bacterium]
MSEVQERGRGRPKNVELNLVPFIDLMSVLITFLLITAVWTQVTMIQLGSSVYGKKNPDATEPPPPLSEELVLKLEILESGYVLTVGKEKMKLPLIDGGFDDSGLIARLERVKKMNPNKNDAVLTMVDQLPYERLIRSMDAFLMAGFTQLSVLTGSP